MHACRAGGKAPDLRASHLQSQAASLSLCPGLPCLLWHLLKMLVSGTQHPPAIVASKRRGLAHKAKALAARSWPYTLKDSSGRSHLAGLYS